LRRISLVRRDEWEMRLREREEKCRCALVSIAGCYSRATQ
jgi:hypothetical protein